MRSRFQVICMLLVFLLNLGSNLVYSQKKTRVEILNSDSLLFERKTGSSLKRLIGNVELEHEGIRLFCDSAYMYDDRNLVEAYHDVHILQGDSLHLYGDYLRYKGDIRMAEFRDNVVLIDKKTTVKTDFMDYDLNNDIAHYFNGGIIHNEPDTLISGQGYYYSKQKLFVFIDSVIIENPEYTILSDTLHYNTSSEISYFFGPTQIIGDSSYIYCENGWYDGLNDISQFNKNAYIVLQEQTIRGDSLYYNNGEGFGKAFINVEVHDSTQNATLKGNYALYYRDPQRAMITDSALFIQYSETDTLFVHADTLRSDPDSSGSYKVLRAYYKVKLFKEDLQGKCDSLSYSYSDSVIQLHGDPILWSEENQLSADFIEIHTRNQNLDFIEMHKSAFIVSQEDSSRFNQIKGKDMIGYFRDGELYIIDVIGNGQTIYYAIENNEIVGVNQAESSNITIHIKNKKIYRIKMITKPDGILNPLDEVTENELFLKGFSWLDKDRPKTKWDIFRWK